MSREEGLMMKLEEALASVGLSEHADEFRTYWDASQQRMPKGELPFLEPAFVRSACEAAYLSGEVTERIVAAAKRIAANEALHALAWYCHDCLFRSTDRQVAIGDWPLPAEAMGEQVGLFYVVILLSGTPQRQKIHRERGIPEQVVRDTVLDLALCMERYRPDEVVARPGITVRILPWLLRHWRGQLYRLGRLQFVPGIFNREIRVYRDRETGTVVALSEGGVRYMANGLMDGSGRVYDKEGAWENTLYVTEREVVGNPILPEGRAIQKEVRLPLERWKLVLESGDPIVEIHMPAGPPMTHEVCGDSMRQAAAFFPKYFPDKPFKAFSCGSWLLDPQFEELLPRSSNVVLFQKEFYLVPLAVGDGAMPWQTVPKKGRRLTTMQRAFLKHVERGGRFHPGGCFLLKDDLNWGSQIYRNQTMPWD